jgi:hypothetical protein
MATKSGQKGRYITKVGFYDIYAKDAMKPKKDRRPGSTEVEVGSTVYNIYHSKKLVEKGYKTKDEAVEMAKFLLGDKAVNYGLK